MTWQTFEDWLGVYLWRAAVLLGALLAVLGMAALLAAIAAMLRIAIWGMP